MDVALLVRGAGIPLEGRLVVAVTENLVIQTERIVAYGSRRIYRLLKTMVTGRGHQRMQHLGRNPRIILMTWWLVL